MRKHWKKIVSLMLTIVMLTGALQSTAFAEDTSPALTLDTAYEVSLEEDGAAVVTFTPETSGYYAFSSSEGGEEYDPYIAGVYTADGERVSLALGAEDQYTGDDFWAVYKFTGGETYTIELAKFGSGASGYSVMVSAYEFEISAELQLNTPTAVVPAEDYLFYTFIPEVTGEYVFYSADIEDDNADSDPYIELFGYPMPVAGDSDDYENMQFWAVYRLTAGEEYIFRLSDYDSSVVGFNVTVSEYYGILSQPTVSKPSVEVTYPEKVESYQWYTISEEAAVTDEEADEFEDPDYGTASFNPDTNVWTGISQEMELDSGIYMHVYFTIDLAAGDTLTVQSSDTIIYCICANENNSVNLPIVGNGNMATTVTVPQDDSYFLGLVTSSSTTTIRAWVNAEESCEKLDGQTTNTLTAYEKDTVYVCKVTYENGSEVVSDMLTFNQAFILQPATNAPYVEVTYPDDVKSYAWHEVTGDGDIITEENADKYLDPDYGDASFDPATNTWFGSPYPEEDGYYNHAYFTTNLEAGDALTVRSSDMIFDAYLWKADTDSSVESTYDNGNMVTFNIDVAGKYELYLVTMSPTTAITAWAGELELAETPLDGQNSAKLTAAEAGKSYACVVTYKDDTILTSDIFTASQATLTAIEAAKKQEKADAVAAQIFALPATVTLNDAAAINAAKSAYDALSAEEKALLDSATVAKLNNAIAALEKLSNGGNNNDNANGGNGDGKESPNTGDNGNILYLSLVLLVSGCIFVMLLIVFRKEKVESYQ